MVKNLFLIAAACGLVVNLVSDLSIFKQHKDAILTGAWVNQSYEVSQAIAAVKISILESKIKNQPDLELVPKLKNLSQLAKDLPVEKKILSRLVEFSAVKLFEQSASREALVSLTELQLEVDEQIRLRVKNDEHSNSNVMTSALYANIFDIFLIFLFVGFYFYELRRAGRVQSALTQTLADVDANNQNLQMVLAKKNSQIKSTVHDLKNPLGSIRGFAELMTDEVDNKDSILKMAKVIQNVSNNSLALVGALLEDGDLERKPFEKLNLIDCLQETCTFLGPVARKKNQQILFLPPLDQAATTGYRYQIQNIFFNIIGNALKFSPAGTQVQILTNFAEGYFITDIIDQGPGFLPSDFSKIFNPGSTLSARPTGNEISTGFGLSSARESIEKIGGRIEILKTASSGAVVRIQLLAQKITIQENLAN